MNCSSCGSPILANQQFCRSCGVELRGDGPKGVNPRLWPLIGVVLAFLGIMFALAGKLAGVEWMLYTGVFVSIWGMFMVPIASLLRGITRRKPTPVTPLEIMPYAVATNKLLPIGENDFVPSVVEGTTDLLKAPAAADRDRRA